MAKGKSHHDSEDQASQESHAVPDAVRAVSARDVTLLLGQAQQGDREARASLFRAVEGELHKIAAKHMRGERPDHTLQTTVLVNDAFIRLVGNAADISWHDRTHFYRAAARAMRQMLVDHERQRRTKKRGGGRERSPIKVEELGKEQFRIDLLALNEALEKLAELDPQQSEVVELHYFGGCTLDETAQMLGVSRTTVKREWAAAKAWLHLELTRSEI